MDAPFAAKAKQERTAQHIAEADDARKRVDGDSRDDIALPLCDHGLAFLSQICSLRLDVECVEELLHESTPMNPNPSLTVRVVAEFYNHREFPEGYVS